MDHRWVARSLVVGLHLALLAALWLHRPAPLAERGERRVTTVRIVQPKPAPPPLAQTRPPPPRAAAPAVPAITPPAFTTEAEPKTPVQAAPTAPAAEAPHPEPPRTALRLTLPPGFAASSSSLTNPALNDPRSNTAKRTLESRIADAAEATGPWVSERTSDHRTLLRRGDTCVEVLRSRIADTDPFNGNVAPRTVPMFGKPYKCK